MQEGTSPYTELLAAFGSEGARQARSGALRMYLGTVTRVSPLEVTVNGTPQRAVDGKLWCNSALLPGSARAAGLTGPTGELGATLAGPAGEIGATLASLSGTIGASVNCHEGSISQLTATGSGGLSGRLSANGTGSLTGTLALDGAGSIAGTLKLTDHGFAVGDTLLLLSPDEQNFYILCKEVRL